MKITDFVIKDRNCYFEHFRQGNFYYRVLNVSSDEVYIFPVPLADLGEATLNDKEKSVLMMRYIRKAIEENTLVRYTDNTPDIERGES
mgnify:CR=1 FL=1